MTTLPLLTPLNQVENPLINVFNAVIDGVQQLAVNARDLHSFLNVGRKFATWITERISQYQFIENQDFISFSQNGEKPKGGRPTVEYHLTLDMAKELAMVENNEQGRKVRRYFIQCEKAVYKSDSHQRQALVTACDKLAVGHALRSDVYTMVGNHFGYDDVVSIPTPLLPEAVAFVYELLLAKQKNNTVNEQEANYNAQWRLIGLLEYDRVSKELRQLQEKLSDLSQDLYRINRTKGLIYDAISEQRIHATNDYKQRLVEAQAFIEKQHEMKCLRF